MMRVVSFRKAVLAGIGGAAVMEICSAVAALAGLPTVDFVTQLSSVFFDHSPALANASALAVHLGIGVCWAIFYAFFFWGRLRAPPLIQGLIFSLLPAALAIFIVYPELRLMRLHSEVVSLDIRSFLEPLSPFAAGSLLVAHLLFGLTVGAIYRRPVGYAAGTKPRTPALRRPRPEHGERAGNSSGFMFATGIECSYPTIEHGRWRRDEMQSTRHYSLWQHDFELARETGITHIRYGPPLHLIFEGIGRYDWDYCDPQMAELRDHGPEPIVDLCHFGLPSWLGDFQNGDIGAALAEYAARVRRALSVGALLYAGQRDVRVRPDERARRYLERATARRRRLRSGGVEPRQCQHRDERRDPETPAGRDLHQQRKQRILPAVLPRPACPAGCRRSERAPVPAARPDLRASAEQADARPSARPGHCG